MWWNRAVSPVIAILLLTVMAISLAYASWMWYSSLREGISAEMEQKSYEDVARLYAGIKIVSATTAGYTIKNTGSITLYNIKIYENGTLIATHEKLEPGQSLSNSVSLTEGSTLIAVAKYADDRVIVVKAPVLKLGVSVTSISATGNTTSLSLSTYTLPVSSNQTEIS